MEHAVLVLLVIGCVHVSFGAMGVLAQFRIHTAIIDSTVWFCVKRNVHTGKKTFCGSKYHNVARSGALFDVVEPCLWCKTAGMGRVSLRVSGVLLAHEAYFPRGLRWLHNFLINIAPFLCRCDPETLFSCWIDPRDDTWSDEWAWVCVFVSF